MRVPGSLLRQQITVEPYQGNSAFEPKYGEPVTMQARVEGKRRTVRKISAGADSGSDVISTASATIRPTVDVPALSKVTAPNPVTGETTDYVVIDVIVGQGLNRPAFLELLLS